MSTFAINLTLSVFHHIKFFNDNYDHPLMDETYFDLVSQGSSYEGVTSIDIDLKRVVLSSMSEWLEKRFDPVYQETLLGVPHLLSFLKSPAELPESWRTKQNDAKQTTDDPEAKPVLVNPVIHFPRELFQRKQTQEWFVPYMSLGRSWYFNYRIIPTRFEAHDLVARIV